MTIPEPPHQIQHATAVELPSSPVMPSPMVEVVALACVSLTQLGGAWANERAETVLPVSPQENDIGRTRCSRSLHRKDIAQDRPRQLLRLQPGLQGPYSG